MPSSGPSLAVSATGNAGGPILWTNDSNALANDDTTMDSSPDAADGDYTEREYFLDFSGLSVPSDATVDGIEVIVRWKGTEGTGSGTQLDISTEIVVGGSIGPPYSSIKSTGSYDPDDVFRTTTMGGPSDPWALSLTGADIDADFGVTVRASFGGGAKTTYAHIAWVKMTVYYTAGGGGGGQPYIARVSGVPGVRLGGASFGRGW